MTIFANPFLIRQSDAVQVENPTPTDWVFRVAGDGTLTVDFLQTVSDLKVRVHLMGPGAKCQINCGYLVNDNNKINIDIQVLHESQETTSVQQIRGLVTDRADVCFAGTITIPYDSQKCDGRQNHRAIVLSDLARVSATPQLEIWADDVQCAHGSAIGPLNPEHLFYLQTRGISESDAKRLLIGSFFNDLFADDFNPLIQEWMSAHV